MRTNQMNEAETIDHTKPDSQTNSNQRGLLYRCWAGWIRPIGMVFLVVFTFRSSIADWNDVPTQSMEPTILVGDRIFVNKLAYDFRVPFAGWRLASWSDPEAGEIIVCWSPDEDKRLVKRVVGVPGDTVAMRNGRLMLNGAALSVSPTLDTSLLEDLTDAGPFEGAVETIGGVEHAILLQPTRARSAARNMAPVVVPDGCFLVMGDNRDNSRDSRAFGFVKREDVVGRAIGIAASVDLQDHFSPRWSRFGMGLD